MHIFHGYSCDFILFMNKSNLVPRKYLQSKIKEKLILGGFYRKTRFINYLSYSLQYFTILITLLTVNNNY